MTTLHVLLLPLLAVSQWLLLRGVPGLIAWAAPIAAYGYAAFYTALDELAGIPAGELTKLNAERGLQTDAVEVDRLFTVGNDLGEIGVWCFGIACAAAAVAVGGRVGRRALPGAVLVVAAAVVLSPGGVHINWPWALGSCLPWPWGLGCWPRYCSIRSHATARRLGTRTSSEPAAT